MAVNIETFQRSDLALEQAISNQVIKADMDAFYDIQLGANGNSILVDPVNGDPYIYERGGDFRVWSTDPKSGTDKMRARMQCKMFFEKLNAPREESAPECPAP